MVLLFLKVFFTTPMERPPKNGFWTLQQHLLATKIVEHAFLSRCAGIKKVFQGQVKDVQRMTQRFGRSTRRYFEPVCKSSHYHGEQWFVFSRLDRIFPTFLYSNDMNLFWAIAKMSGNAQGCLYLRICHRTILHYQFTHDSNVLWHIGCFWTNFTDQVF